MVRFRAVSPVVSVVLIVALVVVLAATLSTFALGIGEELRDPAPNVAQSSGEFVGPDGYEGGVVRITHVAGETVAVDDLEVAVAAPCGNTRLVNLPAEGGNTPLASSSPYEDENLQGDDIISKGFYKEDWSAGVLHKSTKNTFAAGDSFEFRLRSTTCPLEQGDKVTVRVIHAPTNAVIIKEELRAS